MKKNHSRSQSKHIKEKAADQSQRFERTKIIISIVAIIVPATVGVLAIINSNLMGKFNGNIPILEYHVNQIVDGEFYLEVKNAGKVSASNVTITIIAWPEFDIADCKSNPDYQALQSEIINQNSKKDGYINSSLIIYKVFKMPSDSKFGFSCKIYFSVVPDRDYALYSVERSLLFHGAYFSSPNAEGTLQPVPRCYPLTKREISSITSWEFQDISLDNVIIDIDVLVENGAPAKGGEELPTISILIPNEMEEGSGTYDITYCLGIDKTQFSTTAP